MFPHPPTTNKVNNSRSSTHFHQRFPGKGDTLKSPVVRSPYRNTMESSSSSTRRTTRSSTSSSSTKTPNNVRPLERTDSFSIFTPLPAIKNKNDEHVKMKGNKKPSNKRALPKHTSSTSNKPIEKMEDDILSDTIKKMRLGSGFLSLGSSSSTSDQIELKAERDSNNDIEIGDRIAITKNNIETASSEIDLNIHLVIRLPKGNRIEHCFSSKDTLTIILDFLSKKMKTPVNFKKYALFTNEVPKKELKSRKATLASLGIKDRTVLALDTRD